MKKEKLEAIVTASEYIKNLIKAIKDMSEMMYSGNEAEGMNVISQVVDGLDYINKVVYLTDNVFGRIENIDGLNEYLDEIVNAIEGEDYILVGDLFNYEVKPILEEVENAFIDSLENEAE